MGSIADKLSKLMETKSAIKSAITGKGVTVADSDPFSSYAGKIAQIGTVLKIPKRQSTSEVYFKVEIPNSGGNINFTLTDFDWNYSTSPDGVNWSEPIEYTAGEIAEIGFSEKDYPLCQALVKIVSKGPYEPRYLDVNAGTETYVCIPTEYAFIEWYYDKSTLSAADYRTAYNIVTGQGEMT